MAKPNEKRAGLKMALSVLFWLAVWQLASIAVNETLFLPSPLSVLQALSGLWSTALFWQSIGQSLGRIALGFALGLVVGCALAVLAARFSLVEVMLRPLMLLVRATPVASFIILALVWISSAQLSTFISFLMVLPVLYSAIAVGIAGADKRLLEMSRVFRVGAMRRVRAIYIPALMPGFLAACELALGMCWKSGVAAEVIAQPAGTIGERLYMAKIFLMTPQLFAWTAVIITLCWAFGRLVLWLLRRSAKALEGGAA